MKQLLILFLSCLLLNPCFGGVNLAGDADRVFIIDSDDLTGTPLSVFLWFNPDSLATQQAIVNKYDAGSNQRSWSMQTNSVNKARIQVTLSSVLNPFTGIQVTTDNDVLTVGTWSHIGFVFDGGATSLVIYVGGVSVPYSTDSGSIPTTTANNILTIRIGTNEGGLLPINGKISEFTLWKGGTALTSDEALLLGTSKGKRMALQIQPSSLKCYLPLNDRPDGEVGIQGDVYVDRSGNGNTGSGTDANGNSTNIAEEVLSYP